MKRRIFSVALTLVLGAVSVIPAGAADPSQSELDQLREQRAKYQSQQAQLQEGAVVSQAGLVDAQAQLVKQQARVQEQTKKVQGILDELKGLKEVRAKAVEESYLASKDNDTLMALLGSGTLSEFLKKSQYSDFILKQKNDAVGGISDKIAELDRARQDLVTEQNALESQISSLRDQIAYIQQQLAANKENLSDVDSQLTSLTGLNSLISRDFVQRNEPVNGQYKFAGGGTEHGLGMSQYGAKGAAEHGSNYKQILSHYYQGTQLSSVGSFSVSGQGDSESYVARVVTAEISSRWPTETLKAQAIAARSYAYMNKGNQDCTPRTQACASSASPEARAAVEATRGQVVTYAGQVIPAYFHSTSGGHTENNENVWGGRPLPWLRGVPSPYETDSPHWSWGTGSYSREQMQAILDSDSLHRASVGTLQTIKIVGRGVGGRVTAVQIIGSAGTKTISGPTFKSIFNSSSASGSDYLQSTLFGFSG